MAVGIKYGLLVGAEYGVLCVLAPQPAGAMIFWLIQMLHLTTYTVITWHRTRLVISTIGGVAASVASGLMLGLQAAGYTWDTIPTPWAVPVYGLMIVVPASVFAESWLHRREWAEWREHVEHLGLWDMLLMRHIPTLTRRGA